jgi:hypothetical protein
MLKTVQSIVRFVSQISFVSTEAYLIQPLRPMLQILLSSRVLSSKEERSGSQNGRGP